MPSSTLAILMVFSAIGTVPESFVSAKAEAPEEFPTELLPKFKNGASRTLLLICGGSCVAERTQVARSTREYNSLNNLSNDAAIRFRVEYLRQKEGRASDVRLVNLFYVVARRPIRYPYGEDMHGVKGWLWSLDAAPRSLLDHRELNVWIDETSSTRTNACQPASLLFIHDRERCPMPHSLALLNIVVRAAEGVRDDNFVVLERPLARNLEIVLNWRLPHLRGACRALVLLVGERYVNLDVDTDAAELIELAAPTLDGSNCSLSALINSSRSSWEVRPAPNDVLLEFLSDEHLIKGLEHNQMYMLVGVIGGMAVVALAISIFWGLSGTSFTSKQG